VAEDRCPGAPFGARPWAVLQHAAADGPGLVTDVLDRSGCRIELVRLDGGDPLPAAADIDGLVVLGGSMAVGDARAHPWLPAERELIGAVALSGRPVLGLCLGAQQLALALGAEVTAAGVAEIGLGTVELTVPGRRDPVLGPEYGGLGPNAIPCVHWHHDTFSLPDGAVHLAITPAVPNQAFRWGDLVYGFQFHVEVDRALAEGWRPLLPPGVTLDPGALGPVEAAGRRILARFVGQAVGRTVPWAGSSRAPVVH
jgi:GMP synthase (glutamine-hydrolysing)